MRLRCGFNAIQHPARVNAAGPIQAPRCARHPRIAWICGDCYVAGRCAHPPNHASGSAIGVPRRSTPCVDAFRGDNRHAAMRLRCGFNAGQNPACVNAAGPIQAPRCARHPRMAWIYGDRCLAGRCAHPPNHPSGFAIVVPRRSTPCVDAFRDNRRAVMRLRCGLSAGQNPAWVNAASLDTCAALRAASTHGVDLRDCYLAGRCAHPPNHASGFAIVVPRRSTPCVDAFRGDNRHAAMRLRCGLNAGEYPGGSMPPARYMRRAARGIHAWRGSTGLLPCRSLCPFAKPRLGFHDRGAT